MSGIKHMIWSNYNLDVDDGWRETYEEDLIANGFNIIGYSDENVYDYMIDANNGYLDDERKNLAIQENDKIIAIGDNGLWNGIVSRYKLINSGNIKDCLYDDVCDYCEWYVDDEGEFRFTGSHHDGNNHYMYRGLKDDIPDDIYDAICNGAVDTKYLYEHLNEFTFKLGPEIAEVYGWKLHEEVEKAAPQPKRKEKDTDIDL